MKEAVGLKRIAQYILILSGIVFTIAGMYKSVFYGCDIDESYAISLAYRLVRGDHLFKEMWEVHQTSGIFMTPFIWIYRILNGTTIGMVVYLRIIGTMIQLILAVLLFFALKEYASFEFRYIFSVIFLNFSPKYSQILEFCFLEYLFSVGMIIAFLYYLSTKNKIWLCFVGLFQACAILAYP